MPIVFTDQFWVIDPYAPPPVGTLLTPSVFTVIDNNTDVLVDSWNNDSIDGSDIRSVYVGDTVTVMKANGQTVTITGATFYLADGRQVFTPTDGSFLPTGTFVSSTWVSNGNGSVPVPTFAPPCFTPGTRIETVDGERAVETLATGDLVICADHGPTPVVFVHRRHLAAGHLAAHPRHRPIRIAAGALGSDLPCRDLVLSPQHRVVLRSAVVRRMFGADEIMVPAAQLVGQAGIERLAVESVDYVHVLLAHHGVLSAEGAPAESLFLGPNVHEGLTERDIDVLRARLPGAWQGMEPARPFVQGRRLKTLLERLNDNRKPLVEVPQPAANARRMAG